jgi:hypothetical protein
MSQIQGKVRYIKVGDDFGFAKIQEDGTGDEEVFAVWWYQAGQTKPPTYRRTIQGMQISLLTEALVNGLSVIIQRNDNTGAFEFVQLLAAP